MPQVPIETLSFHYILAASPCLLKGQLFGIVRVSLNAWTSSARSWRCSMACKTRRKLQRSQGEASPNGQGRFSSSTRTTRNMRLNSQEAKRPEQASFGRQIQLATLHQHRMSPLWSLPTPLQ